MKNEVTDTIDTLAPVSKEELDLLVKKTIKAFKIKGSPITKILDISSLVDAIYCMFASQVDSKTFISAEFNGDNNCSESCPCSI